jgi:signal peptidase I
MAQTNQEISSTVREKEPWLAVNLSMFFPGIGQIYAGKRTRGFLIIAAHIFCLAAGLGILISGDGNASLGIGLIIMSWAIALWSLFDAHASARKTNSWQRQFEELRNSQKDPWLAVFLSRLILGLGHFYINQIWIGLILIIFLVLGFVYPWAGILGLIITPFAVYHAYIATPTERQKNRKLMKIVAVAIVAFPILVGGSLALLIRQFIAEARFIPSGAMIPTLEIDDRLMINKLNYQFSSPNRGDIVVFEPTETLQQQNYRDAFIKRIIGLPGEKVEVIGGKVYINDRPLEEPYIQEIPRYKFGPVTVPANSYFVLGDNRNNSYDSHYWGFVPRANIIGKATQRFWPPERAGKVQ